MRWSLYFDGIYDGSFVGLCFFFSIINAIDGHMWRFGAMAVCTIVGVWSIMNKRRKFKRFDAKDGK